MHDESDKPLSSVGDDALEARIVAWVLGEASSFEAAELEKLCAEDPALRRFERRIRDLHGLIGEDVKAGPDAGWRLPEAKRGKITDLLGVEAAEPVAAKRTNRYFTRRILLAAAACFMISVIAYSSFGPAAKKEAVPDGVVASMPSTDAAKEAASGVRTKVGYDIGSDVAWADSGSLAKPAIVPEQQVPQIAKAKEASRGEVAGASGMGGADSFARTAPAKMDSLASNTGPPRGQEALGRNTPSLLGSTDSGGLKSDLAGVAGGGTPMPQGETAPADVRFNELAELAKKQAPAATASPAAPAAMPAEPSVIAGKAIVRDGSEWKSESAVRLNFDAQADLNAAAAYFFNQPKPNAAIAGPGRAAGYSVGGVLKDTASPGGARETSFEIAGHESALSMREGALAPMATKPQWLGLAADKSGEPVLGEVTQSFESAEELRKAGKYDEARQIAAAALAADPNNAEAKHLTQSLADPITGDQALAYRNKEQEDQARLSLLTAEGFYKLGEYDEASRAYEDALKVDPFNKAARRGRERVAAARADYDRAAYDNARSELLAQVDGGWDLKLPPLTDEQVIEKTNSIKIPVISFEDSSIAEVLEFLRRRSVELDRASGDAERKGVPMVAVDPEGKSVDPQSLRIAKLELREVTLAEAVKQVAAAAGLQHEVKNGTIVFSSRPETEEKPAPNEKADETSAASQPFSTFSLHVSDASFKLAKAALERGEQPDPGNIRPEEFYNAFDYGDPAPGRGEPVACALEQCAHPVIPQRNLVRIAVRAGAAGRGQSTPLNLTLLLDSSGSMEREDRHQGMAMAVQQLAGLLKEGDTVSVIGFSRQPRLLVDRLPGTRAHELNRLLAQTPSEGGTNLEEGLKLAEELARRQFKATAQNRIVLFTDGAANLGDAEPETLQARIEAMRQEGIAFDAAGFGADGLNDKLLERLTRNGNGRYYIVDRPEDADADFAKQLAGAFRPAAENVKVQVRFNPARVGKYKLIGFEEHRLNREDFRNDAVDAAEMAAEEAGNALYQIEPLPGGEGEIGEVSVRFRDAASGQMVERTWTLPYEAQAPAFDLAPPSIQLAALSAFTAEKLRQSPMAAAIDFQQLGPILAKVKARYPNSQAVSDLGTMIGKLK